MTRKTGWPVRVKVAHVTAGVAGRRCRAWGPGPFGTIDLSDPNGLGIRTPGRPLSRLPAAAGLVDVLQGGMPGRQAEGFIHLGHCPSRAELFRPGNAIARPGGKACKKRGNPAAVCGRTLRYTRRQLAVAARIRELFDQGTPWPRRCASWTWKTTRPPSALTARLHQRLAGHGLPES
jgi:hypothetical protein